MIWRILLVLWQYRELISRIRDFFAKFRKKPKAESFSPYRDDFKGTNQRAPYPPMSDIDPR